MRLSLTIWKQAGAIKINLSSSEQEGNTRFVIEGHQTGNNQRFLTTKEIEQLQALLRELTFHAMPQPTKHSGTSYMLQLYNGFNSATFNWCTETPKEWGKLQDLADLLLNAYHQ